MATSVLKPNAPLQWGDEEFDDETAQDQLEDGIRIDVEHSVNEKGQKIKITRKIRKVVVKKRINRVVEERRNNWQKFGLALRNYQIMSKGDLVEFIFEKTAKKVQKDLEEQLKKEVADYVSRASKPTGGNWVAMRKAKEEAETDGPVLRGPGGVRLSGSQYPISRRQDDLISIRVSNLSEDVTDYELRDLFSQYGSLTRVFLATDKITGTNKGFAFISYATRQQAENAMTKLQGFGWHHLILQLEWSKGGNKL